ncbi:MAG: translation elongation factor Ts [Phycisphaerales bacterium]|jgi:elongation factor Ts|nr:translation elongation factor Ts [Phycisphaerales bacterium]
MTIAAKDVMSLRQKTGLGMMDCKQALAANDGDMTAAEEWIRAKRKGKMDTRTERTTGEGRVAIAIGADGAAIVEVLTETDFTARNDEFTAMMEVVIAGALAASAGPVICTDAMTAAIDNIRIKTGENANYARGEKLEGGTFGEYVHHDGKRACLLQVEGACDAATLKGICQHITFYDPAAISPDDVSQDKLDEIRAKAIQEAKDSGKPEEIAQKMSEGKVRKFLEENTLIKQKYVLDESTTIEEILPAGCTIKKFVRYTLGG